MNNAHLSLGYDESITVTSGETRVFVHRDENGILSLSLADDRRLGDLFQFEWREYPHKLFTQFWSPRGVDISEKRPN